VPQPASQADWEMIMVMPLGVLANQLVKIEGELRFLTMKAAEHSGEDGLRSNKSADARLELIHEVLESIRSLLAKLRDDIHPQEPTAHLTRKPSPEWDD
jgi:hypothetical protein